MAASSCHLFERRVIVQLDISLAGCHAEQIVGEVPGEFIHFVSKVFGKLDLVCARINKGDFIVLVSHRNVVSVRAPANIDVLSLCVDLCCAFSSYKQESLNKTFKSMPFTLLFSYIFDPKCEQFDRWMQWLGDLGE